MSGLSILPPPIYFLLGERGIRRKRMESFRFSYPGRLISITLMARAGDRTWVPYGGGGKGTSDSSSPH